jgi:hypothetical protein
MVGAKLQRGQNAFHDELSARWVYQGKVIQPHDIANGDNGSGSQKLK